MGETSRASVNVPTILNHPGHRARNVFDYVETQVRSGVSHRIVPRGDYDGEAL